MATTKSTGPRKPVGRVHTATAAAKPSVAKKPEAKKPAAKKPAPKKPG